jgi:hypothetical protein
MLKRFSGSRQNRLATSQAPNLSFLPMQRLIITIILFLFYSKLFGQIKINDLSKIKTVSHAEEFNKTNPNAGVKIFYIESGSDTTEILLPLYTKKAGFTFSIDDISYKILEIDSTLSFRVSYIYLNGDVFSRNQIDSIRQEIISKYKEGTSFFELAQQYGMDGNTTGDTKWFPENMMVKEFENAVRSHKKNDIFTVDTPGKNWYHVVLKTFDDTFVKKVTLLRAKSGNQ